MKKYKIIWNGKTIKEDLTLEDAEKYKNNILLDELDNVKVEQQF